MVKKDSLKYQQICRAILICCNKKEKIGIEHLYDSDIYDISEMLKRQGVGVSYRDVENVLDALVEEEGSNEQ